MATSKSTPTTGPADASVVPAKSTPTTGTTDTSTVTAEQRKGLDADAPVRDDEPADADAPDLTEDEALDQVASVQSGFAVPAELPAVKLPVFPAPALNVATLDGIPAPVDRSTELVVDEHSGAIVSAPVVVDDVDADDEKNTNGVDKA